MKRETKRNEKSTRQVSREIRSHFLSSKAKICRYKGNPTHIQLSNQHAHPDLPHHLLALPAHRPTPPSLPSLPVKQAKPPQERFRKLPSHAVLLERWEEEGGGDGERWIEVGVEDELGEEEGEERVEMTRWEREEKTWASIERSEGKEIIIIKNGDASKRELERTKGRKEGEKRKLTIQRQHVLLMQRLDQFCVRGLDDGFQVGEGIFCAFSLRRRRKQKEVDEFRVELNVSLLPSPSLPFFFPFPFPPFHRPQLITPTR